MSKDETERRVPNLRFKGFTDDWMQEQILNLGEINPKSDLPEIIEYVDLESVKGATLISHEKLENVTAPSRAQRLAQKGDIFFQTVRPYQKNNYFFDMNNSNFVFSTGYAQIRPTKVNGKFLFYKIQDNSFVVEVLKRATGTSYPAINSNDLSNINFLIPENNAEQKLIGNLLIRLDEIIALEQEKLSKEEKVFDYILSNFLTRIEENTPNIRLNGYNDNWDIVKLGEISQISTGNRNTKDAVINGKYPFYIRSNEIMRSNTYSFDEEAILIPGEGRLGEIYHYINGKYALHQRVYRIGNFSDMVFGEFIYWNMKVFFKRHILRNTSSTTAPSIRKPALDNYKLRIPRSTEEQNKIIILLKSIDTSLDNTKKTINSLNYLKDFLLSNLFV